MEDINNPCITVDEITKKIRQELAKRKQKGKNNCLPFENKKFQPSILGQNNKVIPLNLSSLILDEPFHTRNNGVYHVNEFLKYTNEEFINNAYQAILGRGVDPVGLKLHLNRLDRGITKIEMLGRLRYGPEGRKKRVKIRGLFFPLCANMLYKFPVLGYLIRLAIAIFRLPNSLRGILEFQNYSCSKNQNIQTHINNSCDAIEEKFNQLLEITINDQHNIKELQDTITTVNNSLAEQDGGIAELEDTLTRELSERDNRIGALEELVNHGTIELQRLEANKADKDRCDNRIGALEELVNHGTIELQRLEANKADKEELYAFNEQKAGKDDTNQIRAEIEEMLKQIRDHKLNILDQHRRLRLLLEEARRRLPEPITTGQIENMLKEEDHFLDAMYVSFEDRFRGTREDIKERLKVYLEYIQDSGTGKADSPILDVGCGRGEWLELCKEQGFKASGIDKNNVMVAQCRELHLDVIKTDALTFLREKDSNSFGAITGFHLIEHLPLEMMIAFFDETLRVLKTGGVSIFETPNPENLTVGAFSFHLDPTHRQPLVPESMQFILEQRGFGNVHIKRLHKNPEYFNIKSDSEFKNKWFYNEMNYAVIGYKI